MTTGSGKGTDASPYIRTTTTVDKDGNVTDIHNTVGGQGIEKQI